MVGDSWGEPGTDRKSDREPVQIRSLSVDEDIPVQLVELVADVEDCEPTDLPTLQEAVDTDALETLLTDASEDRFMKVEFEYSGTLISVTNAGNVRVRPLNS